MTRPDTVVVGLLMLVLAHFSCTAPGEEQDATPVSVKRLEDAKHFIVDRGDAEIEVAVLEVA